MSEARVYRGVPVPEWMGWDPADPYSDETNGFATGVDAAIELIADLLLRCLTGMAEDGTSPLAYYSVVGPDVKETDGALLLAAVEAVGEDKISDNGLRDLIAEARHGA